MVRVTIAVSYGTQTIRSVPIPYGQRSLAPSLMTRLRFLGNGYQWSSWNEVYGCSGTQNTTNYMYSVLNKGIDMFFPIKHATIHNTDTPWITLNAKSLNAKKPFPRS